MTDSPTSAVAFQDGFRALRDGRPQEAAEQLGNRGSLKAYRRSPDNPCCPPAFILGTEGP
jgi:hypothetical protein